MSITVQDICTALEEFAPLALQESYDNAGLLLGNRSMEVTAVLLCIDITEEVLKEAVAMNCNMVVSHHPLIFKGLKSITGRNETERCVIYAIQHQLAVYACHTNIDSVKNGVSGKLAEKIGLLNSKILQPKQNMLLKLICFVPTESLEKVREAVFEVGGGQIGAYDCCSYTNEGEGTFRANVGCSPYVGNLGEFHTEPEQRMEIVLPVYLKTKVTKAILASHPYEEPAYDFIPLQNSWTEVGFGIIGDLKTPLSAIAFLNQLKNDVQLITLKHTKITDKLIKKVAVCGGSGAELIQMAKAAGADAYVSGDFKYHDYFLAENSILLADIGHFESEQFTKEIFFEQLTKKLPKFAIRFSEINTNPINYL